MFDSMNRLGRPWIRTLAALCLAGLVAGCGGAGAGAGGSSTSTTSTSVATLVVLTDKVSLPAADGSTSATVTAQVKDASNNVLKNQQVTFSTADTGVSLTPIGTTSLTDSAGQLQVRMDLGSGAAARANRKITVTAASGGVSNTAIVEIIGTRLTITGPDSLTVGSSADYTVTALDGAGAAVPNLPVTVAFAGGTPATSTISTATNGQAKLALTGTTPGNSQVQARATGVEEVSRAITVLGSDTPFRVSSPADGAEVNVNTDQALVVLMRENGAPVVGRPVVIATTRGTVNGGANATVSTNASGEATVTVRSSSAGLSTVTATVFNGSASNSVTSRVNFVSRTPSKLSLSPDPTSISANAIGSSSSTSRLVATVRDATDNPVKGALVTFSAQDPSNGTIHPSTAVSDSSGQAIASFIAGPTSTGPDAVKVTATAFNTNGVVAATDTKSMTVSAVALFIELGTGNTIETVDITTYGMPWSAIVTDANRNPVPGAKVTVSLSAIAFYKGVWVYAGGAWQPRSSANTSALPLRCPSEDRFFPAPDTRRDNNLLDAGEDTNGNTRLDPGSPASVRVTTTDGKTGSDGRATIAITYPRSFGEWVEVTMRVTIATSGTESSVSRTFVLPVVAADVTTQTVAPPNVNAVVPNNDTPAGALVGPYGYRQDCADPN
jgi:hypothetical protein